MQPAFKLMFQANERNSRSRMAQSSDISDISLQGLAPTAQVC